MKALIDTNIVLDDALAREPFAAAAYRITEACAQGDVDGYLSAIAPLNAFYVARKTVGNDGAREMIGKLLTIYSICPLDEASLRAAHASGKADFEDAAQIASALAVGIEVVVTRDPKGFTHATIPILSPLEFIARLDA